MNLVKSFLGIRNIRTCFLVCSFVCLFFFCLIHLFNTKMYIYESYWTFLKLSLFHLHLYLIYRTLPVYTFYTFARKKDRLSFHVKYPSLICRLLPRPWLSWCQISSGRKWSHRPSMRRGRTSRKQAHCWLCSILCEFPKEFVPDFDLYCKGTQIPDFADYRNNFIYINNSFHVMEMLASGYKSQRCTYYFVHNKSLLTGNKAVL